MKKFFTKSIRAILVAIMVFVTCFGVIGCGKDGEGVLDPSGTTALLPNKEITKKEPFKATDFKETNEYIVKEAKSDYKIVISSTADSRENTAAIELQLFFKEATNIELPIIKDDALVHSAENKYFSIGKNALAASAGVSVPSTVKSQGFKILTKGNTVFLIGQSSYGTLYSVYEYLHLDFNYEYYFTDVYSLEKNVTELRLRNYDLTDEPHIDVMTSPNIGFIWNNATNRNRFRCVNTPEWVVPANNNADGRHNIFYIINPSEFGEEHAKWFEPASQAQACFSAQGDASEYEAMQTHFLSVIQKGLKESNANIFTISQNDNAGFCACDKCKSISSQYGANSAVLIMFCNDLLEKVYAWFETPEGEPYERDFYLAFMAYQDIKGAPTGAMQLHDKLAIWLAFDSYKSGLSWEEDAGNKGLYDNVIAWQKYSKNFLFWIYDVDFNNYFYPYDTSAYKSDFYKLMYQLGVRVLNDQSQTQNNSGTAWANLKSYVSNKLRWNVTLNEADLVKDFMKNCYHGAADTVYDIYLSYKANWATVKASVLSGEIQIGDFGGIFSHMADERIFSQSVLESWYNGFKQAFEEIKPLESTDKSAYDKAYKMLCAEIASPLYMLIDMYSAQYSESDLVQMKADFKKYCTDGNIGYYKDSESGAIGNLYQSMGIE